MGTRMLVIWSGLSSCCAPANSMSRALPSCPECTCSAYQRRLMPSSGTGRRRSSGGMSESSCSISSGRISSDTSRSLSRKTKQGQDNLIKKLIEGEDDGGHAEKHVHAHLRGDLEVVHRRPGHLVE